MSFFKEFKHKIFGDVNKPEGEEALNLHDKSVIVAPDKFKGTLTAYEVAGEIAGVVGCKFPGVKVCSFPMADGGEGTAESIAHVLGLEPCVVDGHDALLRPVAVRCFVKGDVCAVDCASIVGLAMLGDCELRPWQASSYGVGEFIMQMLCRGMKRIYVGIGGTACVDGGLGLLQAVGARFYDVAGDDICDGYLRAWHLSSVYGVDFGNVDRNAISAAVVALSDVDVPLMPMPDNGMSSLSFAAQKGVLERDFGLLSCGLSNLTSAVDRTLYAPCECVPFQGAGGGIGYALHRVLHCKCIAGFECVAELNGLKEAMNVQNVAAVITGEGCFDHQSLHGKVVGKLMCIAAENGIPVIVVAGKSGFDDSSMCDSDCMSSDNENVSVFVTSLFLKGGESLNHDSALSSLRGALNGDFLRVLGSKIGISAKYS